MPTNEEGEFELVLGNKQLLSVFFIVVLLLGVFFTMGYIVGRNTMPGGTQLASGRGTPIVVDPPVSSTPPEPGSDPGAERPSPGGATAVPPPKSAEPPAQTAAPPKPEPPPVKPEPVVTEPPKPEPRKAEPSKPASAKAEPPKPPPAAGGTYLQVAATRKAEADLLAEVLSKKGYPTIVTAIPDSALVRVLVGPLASDAIPAAREALQAAGFKPFARGKL